MHHNLLHFESPHQEFMFRHMITACPNLKDFDIHTHDSYEFLYLIKGRITCYIEGHTYDVEPGDLVLTNLRELHKTIPALDQSYERIFVRFRPGFVSGWQTEGYNLFASLENRKLGWDNRIKASDGEQLGLNKDLESLYGHARTGELDDVVMIKTLLTKMLVSMNRFLAANQASPKTSARMDENVKDILEHINTNLASKLTLEALESEFHVSRYHLARIFRQSTGFSINEYITYKRMMQARDLLAKNRVSAQEAAVAVGYNDYSAFYRAFKRIIGLSPAKVKG